MVEKSLVRREEGAGAADPSATRFGLHPLIQQRSAFRIAAQADLDNIAAWRWAAGRGRTDLLLDMATPLRIVFFSSSRRGEALAMLDSVYAQVALAQPRGLALLDLSRGILQYGLGRFVEATQMLRQAVRGLRRGSDRRDHRTGLIWLGQAQMFLGRLDAARHCLEQALASARADRDERAIGDCIGNLGGIDYTLGRFESAVAWMQESLDLRTAAGDELALGLNNLGLAQLFAGRADSAIETLQRGLVASAREPDQDAAATAASPACSSTAASCTRSTSRASARCGAAAGGGTPPATSAPKAGRWSSTSTGLVQQQRAASGRSTYKSKANGESTFVGQGCVAVHGRLRASDESSMTSYYSGC